MRLAGIGGVRRKRQLLQICDSASIPCSIVQSSGAYFFSFFWNNKRTIFLGGDSLFFFFSRICKGVEPFSESWQDHGALSLRNPCSRSHLYWWTNGFVSTEGICMEFSGSKWCRWRARLFIFFFFFFPQLNVISLSQETPLEVMQDSFPRLHFPSRFKNSPMICCFEGSSSTTAATWSLQWMVVVIFSFYFFLTWIARWQTPKPAWLEETTR